MTKTDIERIKRYLMNYFKVNTWEECVDKQKYGNCKKICELVKNEFPNLFDKMFTNLFIEFSPIAKELINDNQEMNGNHYVLTKNNIIYDFSRGSNCINGIYVLTQRKDSLDKYNIIMTNQEKKYIIDSISHL